jgi:hypothetical protein
VQENEENRDDVKAIAICFMQFDREPEELLPIHLIPHVYFPF